MSEVALSRLRGKHPVAVTRDPRLLFLARASARHTLVELGQMDIGDAIAGLVDAVENIYGERCSCADEIVTQWERAFPPACHGKRGPS